MSTPDVQLEPSVNKRPLFKQWLLQGAITGIGSGFLFVLLEILLWRNPYHYLLIAALPIYLAWGLVMGAFQSLILWLITKLIRRHLGIFFRAIVSLLLFALPIVAYWWVGPKSNPEMYHSFGTTQDEVASLRGISGVKVFINWGGIGSDPEELTEAQLRNLVVFALDDAGIEVVPNESSSSPQAILCVNYSYLNDPGMKDYHHSDIRIVLRQDVFLSRDSNLKTEATTWEYGGSGYSGGTLRNSAIQDALARFVEDHQRANSDYVAPDYEEPGRSRVRWELIGFVVVVLLIGMLSGSKFQPWRTLAYGLTRQPREISKLAIVAGIALRSLIIFFLMESILVLILTLQSTYQPHEFWRAHTFASILVAHCILCLSVALGRLKFALVINLVLLANLIVLLLCWFDVNSNRTGFFIVEYSILWAVFILTRLTIAKNAFSYLKQELRYYLID